MDGRPVFVEMKPAAFYGACAVGSQMLPQVQKLTDGALSLPAAVLLLLYRLRKQTHSQAMR
jgi:hypothetical protein